jgi:NaMN:DMB phosphoribosyltransferase
MIQAYTQIAQAQRWLQRYRHKRPLYACILGFTETALIPGISAAGAIPESRRYTAIASS